VRDVMDTMKNLIESRIAEGKKKKGKRQRDDR
jgi:hypothetical protein